MKALTKITPRVILNQIDVGSLQFTQIWRCSPKTGIISYTDKNCLKEGIRHTEKKGRR